MLEKLKTILNPGRMYKINLCGAVLDIILGFLFLYLGFSKEVLAIFWASGLCFVVGGIANWLMLKNGNY